MHGVSLKVWLVVVGLIAASAAQVISPNNCDQLFAGYDYSITWDPSDFSGNSVSIDLYNSGAFWGNIISDTPNSGLYRWLVPYAQAPFDYGCSSQIQITSNLVPENNSTSGTFTLSNPITFGDPATGIRSPYNVLDNLLKVRWSGAEVPLYVIQYHVQGTAQLHQVSHRSDRLAYETMEDHVISGLLPNTTYEFRMAYFLSDTSTVSAWTTWVPFVTYPTLDCTNELITAWFSLEVYDNIRTGEHKYPGFCGDWETAFAFIRSPDYGAIYLERNTGKVVVAYRGTVFADAADNLENLGILVPCSSYIAQTDVNCEISAGFALGYTNTGPATTYRSLIEGYIEDVTFDELIVTGHSQGAAIAAIAYADYEARYGAVIAIFAYTYGGPEPGNDGFGSIVASYGSFVRAVQFDEAGTPDEVTTLPSAAAGYLPAYFTDGFVQLPILPFVLACPVSTNCRSQGTGVNPPFYCHCVRGYFNNIAELSIIEDFSTVAYSTDYYVYVYEQDSPFEPGPPDDIDIPSDSVTTIPFDGDVVIYYYFSKNSGAALVPIWGLIALFFAMLF